MGRDSVSFTPHLLPLGDQVLDLRRRLRLEVAARKFFSTMLVVHVCSEWAMKLAGALGVLIADG